MTTLNTVVYKTPLHALIAAGPKSSSIQWIDSILTYLTANCVVKKISFLSKAPPPLCFASPLPINVVPKTGLMRELKTVEHGFSALSLAIEMSCPIEVAAALCHLNPKAGALTSPSGDTPLHTVAMRPSSLVVKGKKVLASELLKIMKILVDVYPDALVTANINGKTPLHCLLETHVETRTARFVDLLSRDVDENVWKSRVQSETLIRTVSNNKRMVVSIPLPTVVKNSARTANHFTPASALVIPDAIFGCIPLHYAVMNGISKDIVKFLVKKYPASVTRGDGLNRTALHWTFGAGGNDFMNGDNIANKDTNSRKRQPLHQTYRSSGVIAILLHKDPAFPFEAAKHTDKNLHGVAHRTPLHYAIELIAKNLVDPPSLTLADGDTPTPCLSLKALKFLIKCYRPALLKQDSRGQTPLHVLFRVAHEWNDLQYQKALDIAIAGSLTKNNRPNDLKIFAPPTELLEMLMEKTLTEETVDGQKQEQLGKIHVEAQPETTESREDTNGGDESEEDPDPVDESAVMIQDIRGLLPLHCAVLAVTTPEILSILLDHDPISIIQVTYDPITDERHADSVSKQYDIIPPRSDNYVSSFSGGGRTPLHLAFANPYIARFHTEVTLGPLLFFNLKSEKNADSSLTDINNDTAPQIMINGTVVLKTEDIDGETPLHLAARYNATLSMFRILLKCYPEAATTKSKLGDLPLHLLVDAEYFFSSIQLSLADKGGVEKKESFNDDSNPFEVNNDQGIRDNLREMSKAASTALRLEEFNICGAIFAPSKGWTSDQDDKERSRGRNDIIQRVFLLSKPLIRHNPSLISPCSKHGLLPLHIAIAFHALPYKDLHVMLQEAPHTARIRTVERGFTALDLHSLRSKVAGEISSVETESWRAISQLLFSHEAFPLNDDPTLQSDTFATIRNDKVKLDSCVQQIICELNDVKGMQSYHEVGKHPVDPKHITLGFINDDDLPLKVEKEVEKPVKKQISFGPPKGTTSKSEQKKSEPKIDILSDVATRLWMFFAIYQNAADPSDNYSRYVSEILSKLTFEKMSTLVDIDVADDRMAKKKVLQTEVTLHGYANPHCKAEIHIRSYFAGAYDFESTPGKSILLHKGHGGTSLIVRATEHTFSFQQPVGTGDLKDYVPDHKIDRRPVCIKFTKNRANYENEIRLRAELGIGNSFLHDDSIVPILGHFDSTKLDKLNKKFAWDRMDKRFQKLPTYSRAIETVSHTFQQEFLDISSYPYAIVFPLSMHTHLYESIAHGAMDQDIARCLLKDMGEVLKTLHDQDFIHGDFSMSSMMAFARNNNDAGSVRWQLTKLNSVVPVDSTSYQGMINLDGSRLFESAALPPEMFTKLDHNEIKAYKKYWQAVFQLENNGVSPDLVKPRINPLNGETYVIKCFCKLPEKLQAEMPPLPYELVEACESADIWAFGVFLFTLISGGETLFQANLRTGDMSCMEIIAAWDTDMAERFITQYIKDAVAQDLLRYILVRLDERIELEMDNLLSHPFFLKRDDIPDEFLDYLAEMEDQRKLKRQVKEKQAKELQKCTITVEKKLNIVSPPSELSKLTYDSQSKEVNNEKQVQLLKGTLGIETQLKMDTSTSELLKEAFDPNGSMVQQAPFCYILLPYALRRGNDGKFTTARAQDIQLAECFGARLLALCKTCHFVSCISQSLELGTDKKGQLLHEWTQKMEDDPISSAQSILSSLQLDRAYIELAVKLVALASEDLDSFVADPIKTAQYVLQEYIESLATTFTVLDVAFFYLVDEYTGLPVLDSDDNETYPYVFKNGISDIVYKSLPFMHACVSHVMGASGSVQAFVKLVFEVAYPLVPPSWGVVAKGLEYSLDKKQITSEVQMLQRVTKELMNDENSESAIDCVGELQFLHEFLQHIDMDGSFCGLRPITDGKSILWTSEGGSRMLQEECNQEIDPAKLQN